MNEGGFVDACGEWTGDWGCFLLAWKDEYLLGRAIEIAEGVNGGLFLT